MQGSLKAGKCGSCSFHLNIVNFNLIFGTLRAGGSGIQISTAPPHLEHQMTGRTVKDFAPSFFVVIQVLVVMPIVDGRISVDTPGGTSVIVVPNGIIPDSHGVVGIDGIGRGVSPSFAQNEDVSQPSGQRASVVGKGIPEVVLGSEHFGSGVGGAVDESRIEWMELGFVVGSGVREAVDRLMPGRIESPIFGNQVEDPEPDK